MHPAFENAALGEGEREREREREAGGGGGGESREYCTYFTQPEEKRGHSCLQERSWVQELLQTLLSPSKLGVMWKRN